MRRASWGGSGQLPSWWRAFRTGVAFAVFGIGSLTIAALLFPLLRVLPGTKRRAETRAQWVVHQGFRLFVWLMERLGLIRVSRVGVERLRQGTPVVVVANHPTLIDVVLLISCMPQADCVVKKASSRNAFLRGVVSGAGYIPNDQGEFLVSACVERLREGRFVLLFPEGTRSPKRGLGHFRRGAARIALQSGCDILPVVITCDPPTLMKGDRWYHVPDRAAHLTVEVQAPIDPGQYARTGEAGPLAARRVTNGIRTLYASRLS